MIELENGVTAVQWQGHNVHEVRQFLGALFLRVETVDNRVVLKYKALDGSEVMVQKGQYLVRELTGKLCYLFEEAFEAIYN